MKKTLILTLIILTLLPVVYAANDFSYNRLYEGTQPIDGFNYSINVNHSIFTDSWFTDIGLFTTVNTTTFENNGGTLSISMPWLNGVIGDLACLLSGGSDCEMDGDIRMNGNDIDMGSGDINDVRNLQVNDNVSIGNTLDMTNGSVFNLWELVSTGGSRIATGTNPAYSMFGGLDSAEIFSNNQTIGDGVTTHALLVTESGNEKVIAAWQSGKNDSGQYTRNSGGYFPDLGLTNVSILTNMEEMWTRFGIIPFADYFSAENKTSIAVLWAFESQKLFLHDDIGNGQFFGEGDFLWSARDGTDIDLYGGEGVHIRKEEIKEFGFVIGDNITSLNANFDSGVLSPFVRTTDAVGGILTDWRVSANAQCHEEDCASALGGSGSPLRSMQANFSSLDQDNLNLSWWLTTNQGGGDLFTVDVNNNEGSGDVNIFSTSSTIIDEYQSIILPSSMEDRAIVTVIFNYVGNNPSQDVVFVDEILVVGVATTTTLANVTVFDASIQLGDKTCGIELSVEEGHQDLNITCDRINLIGDVTAVDVTEVSINVTDNVTANNFIARDNFIGNGSLLFDVNFTEVDPFAFYQDGSKNATGNFSGDGSFSLVDWVIVKVQEFRFVTGEVMKIVNGLFDFSVGINAPIVYTPSLNGNFNFTDEPIGDLLLDGNNDYMNVGADSSLDFGAATNFSYFVWVKDIHTDTGRWHMLADKRSSGTVGWGFAIDRNNPPNGWLVFRTSTTITSTLQIQDSDWHLVGISVNRGTNQVTFHKDGATNTQSFSDGDFDTATDMLIGKRSFAPVTNSYNGLMDEIMLFNSFVGSTEANAIFNAGRNAGSYAGASAGNLVSQWRFDDETADDDKGINNGTLFNQAEVITTMQNFYDLDGDLIVREDLTVKEDSIVEGDLNVDGDINMSSNTATLETTGNLDIEGTATIVGKVLAGAGTGGNPTYSFIIDSDTGMFRSNANTINFVTSGGERLEIDSTEATFTVPVSSDKLALGSNTLVGLSSGDANISTLYYDTLTAKSPSISELADGMIGIVDWDSLTLIKCNPKIKGDCPIESENKMNKIYTKRENEATCLANNYSYDRSGCFEMVKQTATRETAVEIYQVEIMEKINTTCQRLDRQLNVILVNCIEEVGTGAYEDAWKFKDDCNWNKDNGLYCEVREVRLN